MEIDKDRVENRRIQNNLKTQLADKEQLNGVSLDKEGEMHANFRVLAKMLGLEPRVLLEMEEVVKEIKADRARREVEKAEKQRRFWKRIWASAACVISVLMLTVLALFFSRDTVEKNVLPPMETKYYVDYVERWGVPEGFFPLTEEQIKHRQHHYRIETQAGKVLRLVHANSAGMPVPIGNTEFQDRPMIAEYEYHSKNDILSKMTSLDRNGKVLLSFKFSGNHLEVAYIESKNEQGIVIDATLSQVTSLMKNLHEKGCTISEIRRMEYLRNEKGEVTKVLFRKGKNRIAAKDADGIAGLEYKLDDQGRITEKTYLDVEGKACPDKQGVAKRVYEYDDAGNLEWGMYLDQNGTPTFNELGWKIARDTYDKNGNCIRCEFFENDRKTLCLHKEGYAILRCKYDERGNMTEIILFGIDGKPCLNKDGYAGWKNTYDERGNRTETAYFGIDGKPCLTNEEIAGWMSQYDEKGNEIRREFFGVQGENIPLGGNDPYDAWEKTFDENSKLLTQTWFYQFKPYEGVKGKNRLYLQYRWKINSTSLFRRR